LGIINGLKHLRANNIIHRDIKTDNVIMKGKIPKIIDFGFARMLSHPEERLVEYLGTPLYMSPQVQEGSTYNSKCGIWSLGVLLYEMPTAHAHDQTVFGL
jgi:calcium-dependent protein kinase